MADADFMPIKNWDHIEFYVGNAKQAAHFYATTFGFQPVAYAGLETGVRDRASYVMQQGKIRFVLTTALAPDSPIAQFAWQHGDGAKDIALEVPDAEHAYNEAIKRGAKSAYEPSNSEDKHGRVKRAAIYTYGDTIHTFIERHDYTGPFLPGYRAIEASGEQRDRDAGLRAIDHVVGNVELGKMNEWVTFYEDVLGFKQIIHFTDADISTEYSALMSKVMEGGHGKIKFPINEPAESQKKGKSQIQEYLDYYGSAGVQHVALITGDIVKTVTKLKAQGVDFLTAIPSYYEELTDRVGKIDEPMEDLARLGILVDRDDDGYLLQIFTKNAQDRPTLFFEVIQRKGARGFGDGNFKALFEAIEREQALRGNL
ncbi:MAG: 4-hydroxyphenylpyruvate dioxygenase [Ktedonobacterales bacterium]|jgi:4-hydroxyphenylpyruvate dioxygenase|nr:MAG: 4-hydroxyphenylpyruvate dioxygenase [Ktedonobacterales bacterium]